MRSMVNDFRVKLRRRLVIEIAERSVALRAMASSSIFSSSPPPSPTHRHEQQTSDAADCHDDAVDGENHQGSIAAVGAAAVAEFRFDASEFRSNAEDEASFTTALAAALEAPAPFVSPGEDTNAPAATPPSILQRIRAVEGGGGAPAEDGVAGAEPGLVGGADSAALLSSDSPEAIRRRKEVLLQQMHGHGGGPGVHVGVEKIRAGEPGANMLNELRVPFAKMWSPSLVPSPDDYGYHIDVVGNVFPPTADASEKADSALPGENSRSPSDSTTSSAGSDGMRGRSDNNGTTMSSSLEPGYVPDPELEEWLSLEGARKPIFIGFGSMIISDTAKLVATIEAAAETTDTRILLQSSWTNMDRQSEEQGTGRKQAAEAEDSTTTSQSPSCSSTSSPPQSPTEMASSWDREEDRKLAVRLRLKELRSTRVYRIGKVPHDWLFPQCAAVVHHGGAGTTAAGLRAGRPTCVCPFFGDQHFWATALQRAGVGVDRGPVGDLTVASLGEAFVRLTRDHAMARRAEAMGARMQHGEDGVTNAVDAFYRHLPLDRMVCDVLLWRGASAIANVAVSCFRPDVAVADADAVEGASEAVVRPAFGNDHTDRKEQGATETISCTVENSQLNIDDSNGNQEGAGTGMGSDLLLSPVVTLRVCPEVFAALCRRKRRVRNEAPRLRARQGQQQQVGVEAGEGDAAESTNIGRAVDAVDGQRRGGCVVYRGACKWGLSGPASLGAGVYQGTVGFVAQSSQALGEAFVRPFATAYRAAAGSSQGNVVYRALEGLGGFVTGARQGLPESGRKFRRALRTLVAKPYSGYTGGGSSERSDEPATAALPVVDAAATQDDGGDTPDMELRAALPCAGGGEGRGQRPRRRALSSARRPRRALVHGRESEGAAGTSMTLECGGIMLPTPPQVDVEDMKVKAAAAFSPKPLVEETAPHGSTSEVAPDDGLAAFVGDDEEVVCSVAKQGEHDAKNDDVAIWHAFDAAAAMYIAWRRHIGGRRSRSRSESGSKMQNKSDATPSSAQNLHQIGIKGSTGTRDGTFEDEDALAMPGEFDLLARVVCELYRIPQSAVRTGTESENVPNNPDAVAAPVLESIKDNIMAQHAAGLNVSRQELSAALFKAAGLPPRAAIDTLLDSVLVSESIEVAAGEDGSDTEGLGSDEEQRAIWFEKDDDEDIEADFEPL